MISAQAAAAEIRRRALVVRNWVPHSPFGRQQEFLALNTREALYGGAAGGGKSDAILMAAAQYLHVPNYAALILRRTYADLALEDAIMARAQSWWCGIPGIKWDPKEKRFEFPSGASVTFGYLDTEVDKFRYQGAAFQFIGFDELTQFTQTKYTYLSSRLRRLASSNVPLRIRAASNPGGIGHDWVHARFVAPKTAIAPFVPSRLDDNVFLDRESYRIQLEALDPTTRAQLLEGVWVRDGGGLVYGHFNPVRNIVMPDEVPPLQYHLAALDFGVNDQNAISILGWRDHDPCIYLLKSRRFTGLVEDVARELRGEDSAYHFVQVVGDVGGMGKLFQAELAARFSIPVHPAEKTNKLGYIRLFNGALANGRLRVVDSIETVDLLDEWGKLPWDERGLKEAEGFANHASDSALYGWRATTAYHNAPLVERPAPGSPEAVAKMAAELETAACQDEEEGTWI